jgi:hypothetical protein
MVTFSITNPPTGAVSWLIDIETGGTPVFNPTTVALTAPIVIAAPVGSSVSVHFLAYSDPVGTSATGTTVLKGAQGFTAVLTDGATYTMNMSTGELVNANPISSISSIIPTIIEFMLVMMIMKMMSSTMPASGSSSPKSAKNVVYPPVSY